MVPKDEGGGRSVVGCSKPAEISVNNCTMGVAPKFKYKGLDDVVEDLEREDMLVASTLRMLIVPYTFILNIVCDRAFSGCLKETIHQLT